MYFFKLDTMTNNIKYLVKVILRKEQKKQLPNRYGQVWT